MSNALAFLLTFTVIYGVFFAIILSPKGRKWMNEV